RVEHVLWAALAPLRAFRRRRRFADAGKALATELVAGEAGEIDVVLRVIARIGRGLDRAHEPPAPAEFHGAYADQVHARLIDRAVGLLDQQTADPAPAEIACKSEPHGAAADNENLFDLVLHVSFHLAVPVFSNGDTCRQSLQKAPDDSRA